MPTTICKQYTLEAAHMLPNHDGKCRNLHGHTYKIEIFVEGTVQPVYARVPDSKEGMVADFGDISKIFNKKIFDVLDHKYLNDALPIPVTTAEMISQWIYFEMVDPVRALGNCHLSKVRVWETKKAYAEFTP